MCLIKLKFLIPFINNYGTMHQFHNASFISFYAPLNKTLIRITFVVMQAWEPGNACNA